ncbi:MAG: hypothetical protein HYY44_03935 [Deltaproteobacteria bacterium]|nr:hypothetical protein [Deltaproteobacteria bacterium]
MAIQVSDAVRALFPGNHFVDVGAGLEEGVLLDLDGIDYVKQEGRQGLLYRAEFRRAVKEATRDRDSFALVGFTRDANTHPKGQMGWDFLKALYGSEAGGQRIWHVRLNGEVLHTAHGPVQGARWLFCWKMVLPATIALCATVGSLRYFLSGNQLQ